MNLKKSANQVGLVGWNHTYYLVQSYKTKRKSLNFYGLVAVFVGLNHSI